MEFASKLRWFLVVTAMVLFLVLVGWGLYSIARSIFNSSAGSDDTAVVEEVDELAFVGSTRLYVDGPVVANSEQRSYSIDVSSGTVVMKVYSSYGQNVIREKSYQNTTESYEAFLAALENAGVPDRREGTTLEDDTAETGVCATGRRYIIELDNSIRRWSTSCSAKQGTAGFSMGPVRSLFQKQVPDFSELMRGIRL